MLSFMTRVQYFTTFSLCPTIPSNFIDALLSNTPSSNTSQDSNIQVHHKLDNEFLDDVSEEPPEPVVDHIPLIRSSSRTIKQPSYLQAYHCN